MPFCNCEPPSQVFPLHVLHSNDMLFNHTVLLLARYLSRIPAQPTAQPAGEDCNLLYTVNTLSGQVYCGGLLLQVLASCGTAARAGSVLRPA